MVEMVEIFNMVKMVEIFKIVEMVEIYWLHWVCVVVGGKGGVQSHFHV